MLSSHLCRLYFVVSLLWLCFQLSDMLNMTLLSALLAGLIRMHDGHARALWRMLGLLKWLLLPILLIHAMFTPGEILFSLSMLHMTREGLQQGMTMSLHLLMFFLAGMTISQLWSRQDWLLLVARMPGFGRRLYPYILMVMPLRQSLGRELLLMKAAWQHRSGRWRHFPRLLESLVRQAIRLGERHAEMLWLRWGEQPAAMMQLSSVSLIDTLRWGVLATVIIVWAYSI